MPWARIPCDKLATIGLFGYQLENQDGRNLWYRGPDGELHCVDRYAPRFWFESVGDAVQAGCAAIRIASVKDAEEVDHLEKIKIQKPVEFPGSNGMANGSGEPN